MQIKEITYQEKAGMPGYSSVLISLTAVLDENDVIDDIYQQLKQIIHDKIAERLSEQEALRDPQSPLTTRQQNYLTALAKKRNMSFEDLEAQYGPIDTVSRASEIIDALLASGV